MAESTTYGNVSSDAVKKATGRGWEEWIALLDDADAAELEHAEIAALLNRDHIESGWWSQTVTVGYEQARGLRKRHEKTDGFSVSVSKTIPASVSSLYSLWVDESLRTAWLEDSAGLAFTTANENKNLRARWPVDDSQLMVYFYEKGEFRCQVVVQCERLATADDVEPRRTFWKSALARLQAQAGGGS